MLCGTSRRTVNPELGHSLVGYPDDIFCSGIHDDVAVTALYLSDARTEAVLLNFDLLCLTARNRSC